MAKPLVPLTIAAPGIFGLNTQLSGAVLPPGWATKAENFVYDDNMRLACRNGSQRDHHFAVKDNKFSADPRDFDAWTKNGTPTITTNSTAGVDGQTLADTVEDVAAGTAQAVYQTYSSGFDVTQPHTFSVWIKKDATDAATRYVSVRLRYTGSTAENNDLDFDTSDGTTNGSPQAQSNNVSVSVTELVTGWWYCTVTATSADAANTAVEGWIFPARGTSFTPDVATTGSCICDQGELIEGTANATIRSMHEYIDDSGTKVNIFAAANKIWKEASGVITDVSGTITTPTADNWQFVNFNGWCVGFQDSHDPIVLTTTGGTFADSGGTQYQSNMVLSAFGRLWTVNGDTLYYSDLLINDFTGGSSGSFDLAKFWPGQDEAVGLAEFNNFLLVFGKHSILVYENMDDVTNGAIVDIISGVGLAERDTVQDVGTDLLFLSHTGLRSLRRTIQEKSMPVTDVSKNVRDDLINDLANETEGQVKSVYSPKDGFYLLSFPDCGQSYYFDLKAPMEDGALRVLTWNIAPTAMIYKQDNTLNFSVEAGYFSTYTQFQDNRDAAGSNGTTYSIDFEGVWNDFGEEVGNLMKIPKSVSVLATGTPQTDVTFKWAVDYSGVFRTITMTFDGDTPPQYAVSTWGNTTYSVAGDFQRVRGQTGSAGQVVKVGLFATINNFRFALQRIDILAKIGKLTL